MQALEGIGVLQIGSRKPVNHALLLLFTTPARESGSRPGEFGHWGPRGPRVILAEPEGPGGQRLGS
jgi:hypothetical protein